MRGAPRIVAFVAGDAVFLCALAVRHSALSNRALPTSAGQTDRLVPLDSQRDSDLETDGWRVLRFITPHIRGQMAEYCLPTIIENIDRLEGVEHGGRMPRRINLDPPDGLQQLGLFGDLPRE